ncbi:hypothetical protein JCM11251_002351 [Rhodosporidiobolus azoricus]
MPPSALAKRRSSTLPLRRASQRSDSTGSQLMAPPLPPSIGGATPSISSSTSSNNLKPTPEDSLKAYKLLEALRKGEKEAIVQLLQEHEATTKQVVSETGVVGEQGISTPLHLAVRCAKPATVDLVFKHQPQTVNVQDARGQTPLHLAAALDRRDVLSFLLDQDEADSMIRDASGKTCLEVVATAEAAGIINVARGKINEIFHAHLGAYVASASSDSSSSAGNRNSVISNASPPATSSPRFSTSTLPPISQEPAASAPLHAPTSHSSSNSRHVSAASGHVSNAAAEKLYHFIALPRSRCIDFNALDPSSGTTVLHEAVRRKDLGIIKLVLGRGGDVLARDKKGKLPVDLAKDERIRSVLRQAANSEGKALQAASASGTSLAAATPGGGPVGALSGSTPAVGGSQSGAGGGPVKPQPMKGYLSKYVNVAKGYRPRWFVLDNGVLSYFHSQEDEGKATRGSISMAVAQIQPPGSEKLKFTVSNKLGKSMPQFYLKGNHPVEVMRWVDHLRQHIEYARGGGDNASSKASTAANSTYASSVSDTRRPSVTIATGGDRMHSSPADSVRGSIDGDDETFNGDDDDIAPHADDFHLMAQSTKTQLELTQQLLSSLIVSRQSSIYEADGSSIRNGEATSRPGSIHSSSGRQADVKEALKRSLASAEQLLDDYVDVVHQREKWFQRRYDKELEAKRMWEESMKEVAAQHAAIEVELQKASRDNTRRKRALQEVRANLGATSPGLSPRASMHVPDEARPNLDQLKEDGSGALPSPLRSPALVASLQTPVSPSRSRTATVTSLSPTRARTRAGTMATPLGPVELEQVVHAALANEEGEESSDEETDDEFFEAIESGALPGLEGEGEGEEEKEKKRSAPAQEMVDNLDMAPYKGYEHLRSNLPITNDDRPSVSLWAILKGSIGKDLTKISFPVYFNEPTSMLERMAEDMEFSECLDHAAADPDSTKRLAYVAAFAMSNYSSTIGRIAKPFNPMLGETFEYVEPKKKYRYISEQVSHHPPISACIGQSPGWDYFGMVDAKSKFMGKSFEIRPTGTAHVTLRIPEAWAHPDCPPAKELPGLRDEHYSWLKVTTSVSNFLLGNPIIDHYGDMIVTNHRTGEVCTLTFKPRGWRGGNACEIKGDVKDASGRKHWDIAGKWSSQLVARRVGTGSGELAPDASLPTNGAGEVPPEYIRLWKNSYKPPNMPFNLTPYAITLNDINDDLAPFLPPTDTRLRPDQHAFEAGQFERANQLKSDLEDHQRATRRKRELGELPPHKPRWFSSKTDADTGTMYWAPARTEENKLEYWEERVKVGTAKLSGQQAEWKDVDPIYGEFQA